MGMNEESQHDRIMKCSEINDAELRVSKSDQSKSQYSIEPSIQFQIICDEFSEDPDEKFNQSAKPCAKTQSTCDSFPK
jgi:hypothetical protein